MKLLLPKGPKYLYDISFDFIAAPIFFFDCSFRLLWIMIVFAGLGYCYYVFSQTLKSYYKYPTEINVKTVYEKQSMFPAITICNYNALA